MNELKIMVCMLIAAFGLHRTITKPGIRADQLLSLRWRQRLAHLVAFALIPITFFGYQSLSTPGVVVPMTLGFVLVVWLLAEPWSTC